MAVAAPVLERNADTQEKEFTRECSNIFITEEERHNSRISENYARLINPESKTRDIIPARQVEEERRTELLLAPVENTAVAREAIIQRPYLVENARADADIFRADSIVNRRVIESAQTAVVTSQAIEEEENEDLRPTQTTIQYKTAGVKKSDEGKIETKSARANKLSLTKKDKIIIAVALAVIVALFVLIIVNSAVISNLSSDVSNLQSTLNQAESTYTEISNEMAEYFEDSNIYQVVSDFAAENNMVLR